MEVQVSLVCAPPLFFLHCCRTELILSNVISSCKFWFLPSPLSVVVALTWCAQVDLSLLLLLVSSKSSSSWWWVTFVGVSGRRWGTCCTLAYLFSLFKERCRAIVKSSAGIVFSCDTVDSWGNCMQKKWMSIIYSLVSIKVTMVFIAIILLSTMRISSISNY